MAYNPAGILNKGAEWSLSAHPPLPVPLWFSYNELVKKAIDGSLELYDPDDPESLNEIPGTRAYLEIQIPISLVFIPDSGIYFGVSNNTRIEFVFPEQTIIPMVHLEAINDSVIEYAMAFELSDWGVYLGANIKGIHRIGIIADISLLRLLNLKQEELEAEYNSDPPPDWVPAADIGLLLRFDHPLQPRIGLSSLNLGGIDFGSAGQVKQLNTIGGALTQNYKELRMTYSADFQDFTYNHFSNNSIKRRIALGFEAAFGINPDNSALVALQLGLRELRYPSFGVSAKLGIFQLHTVQWIENFGTEKNPNPDKRFMFQLLLAF